MLGLGKKHSGQVLGEEQWRWLEEELKKSSAAAATVVVSSVQVLTSNPFVEGWGHFPVERRRLLLALDGTPGLVLLSGDVHHAEVSADTLEVTSSGMTHSCTEPFYGFLSKFILDQYGTHRKKGMYFTGRNFGTIKFDWENMNMTVSVHDMIGNTVLRIERKMGIPTKIDPEYLEDTALPNFDSSLHMRFVFLIIFLIIGMLTIPICKKIINRLKFFQFERRIKRE